MNTSELWDVRRWCFVQAAENLRDIHERYDVDRVIEYAKKIEEYVTG